ncbi:MAG: hypothetical protein QOF32_2534 [Gammaproteobacteria bacterium]|jgi:hypothetical protein|nr:hypothetical protein [Gammaproteobacteria bacterium]
MATEITWPGYFESAYSAAAVRLTTLMKDKKQYLLFGCVELYPNEVPLPPIHIKPETKNVQGDTVVSNVVVMPVREALAWYESALQDGLVVPGINQVVRVNTLGLSPEPALGRLVLAKNLPFECRWHGRPSIHHFVPMNDAPAELGWLTPDTNGPTKTSLREWLANTVGFDLLAYDEFLFSLVLLVPNPALRFFSCILRDQHEDGGERIGVRVQPRRGETLEDMRVWFKEERPEGISTMLECKLDRLGRAEFDLPERCSLAAIGVHSDRYGLLGLDKPRPFIRGFRVDSEVLSTAGSIKVPARRKGEPEGSAPLYARDRNIALRRNVRPASPEHRLTELRFRRDTRSGKARPDGFWQGSARDEVIFSDNRDEAVLFVRHAVSQALYQVIWVDPYFNHIDLREFAFATQYVEVQVQVLIGREHLWKSVEESIPEGRLVGDVFVEDLQALVQELANSGHQVPNVYLLGGPARSYHDRFLVVDDSVWHFGHSFNQVGEAAVSMATRLRQPNAMREMILEDLARAESYIPTWSALKAAQKAARIEAIWPKGSLP